MRFIHTGDLHLDAPMNDVPDRAAVRKAQTDVLAQMILYAKENDIKYIAVVGDLLDTVTPRPTVTAAVTRLLRAAKDITFLLIAGNHDPLNAKGEYCIPLPENVYVFPKTPTVYQTEDGAFIGASFYEGMRECPFGVPPSRGVKVGLFHGSFHDSEPAYALQPAVVGQSDIDYLALGHIHKPGEKQLVGHAWCQICGSPAGHGFDETGERRFLDVTVTDMGVETKSVQTECPIFYEKEICLTADDTDSAIYGKLIGAAETVREKDILRLKVTGQTVCALPTALEGYPNVARIIDRTELPQDTAALENDYSLRGIFVTEMRKKIAAAPESEKEKYIAALRVGLEAFR